MKNSLIIVAALACGSVASSILASMANPGPEVLQQLSPLTEQVRELDSSVDLAAQVPTQVGQFVDVARPLAQK